MNQGGVSILLKDKSIGGDKLLTAEGFLTQFRMAQGYTTMMENLKYFQLEHLIVQN